jgi:hypothetical protein
MEAVAADATVQEFVGKGEDLGRERHVAVEGGVEAGDLRQVRRLRNALRIGARL